MSVGDTGVLSDGFGDIESQHIFVNNKFERDDTGTGGADQDVTAETSVLDDLDRDELAELVYFRCVSTLSIRNVAAGNQSELAHARADLSASINEPDSFTPVDELEVTREVNADPGERLEALQRPDAANQLFRINQVVATDYLDPSSGAGGVGDTGETTVIEGNFMEMGGGPVLDRFDDINVRSGVKSDNVNGLLSNEINLQLYYKVDTFESNRTRTFGRP